MLSKFKTIFFPKHLENGFFVDRNKEFFLIRQIRKQKHKLEIDKKLGNFMLIKWIHEKSMKNSTSMIAFGIKKIVS